MKNFKQYLAIYIILVYAITSCLTFSTTFAAEFGEERCDFNLAELDAEIVGGAIISDKQNSDSGVVRTITTLQKGDGVEYTVNIPQSGNYLVKLIANANTQFSVSVDGVDISGIMSSRSTWFEYNLGNFVCLSEGDKVIKIVAQSNTEKQITIGSLSFELTKDRYYHLPEFMSTIRLGDAKSSSFVLSKDLHYEALTFKPDGYSATQTDAISKGKTIEFDIKSDSVGLYDMAIEIKGGAGKGIYNIYVNDNLVRQNLDLYTPNIYTETYINVGNVGLNKGINTVKFECVGKNPLSSNYNLILYCLKMTYLTDNFEIKQEEKENAVIDVTTEEYKILSSIGIINPDEKYSTIVTRAEFASMVAAIVNASGFSGKNRFKDVSASNKYAEAINYMAEISLMVGDGVNFRPDDSITLAEVAKVITHILGYDAKAIASGGYPDGYMTVINSLKLLSGTKGVAEGNTVLFNDMVKLLYNTLEEKVNVLSSVTSLKNGGTGYHTDRVNTALEYYLDIYVAEGIVENTYITGIYPGANEIEENLVIIDGEIYECGNSNVIEYLGYRVKYYYYEDVNGNVLKCVLPEKTDVKTVNADEIISFKGNKLSYYSKNKAKDVYLETSAKVIYNGKLLISYQDADMKPLYGNLTLIDNNRNSKIDVVFVDDCESYYVKSLDSINESFIPNGNNAKSVSLKDDDLTPTEIYFGGKKIEFNDIEIGDVVTVKKSKKESGLIYTVANVSRKTINGNINYVTDEKIAIADIEYNITPQYKEFAGEDINLGRYVKAFVDIYGNIAYMMLDKSNQAGTYAYVIDIDTDAKHSLSDEYYIKLFNQYNEVLIIPLSEKLKIDDVKVSSKPDETWSKIYNSVKNEPVNGLISYNMNSAGEVSSIYTPSEKQDAVLKYAKDAAFDAEQNKYIYTPTSKYLTKTPATGFEGGFRHNANTLIISVPEDKTDENAYNIATPSDFVSDSSYYLKAYNVDEARNAGILLWEDSVKFSDATDRDVFATVSKIRTGCVDDELVYKITVMSQGKPIEIVSEDISLIDSDLEETIKKTKVGDVISYTLTIGKRIRTFKIRASLNADEYSYQAINPRSAFSYGMTKIYRVEGADVIVGDGTGDETSIAATAIDTSACKEIVAFDKNTKEVYSAGVADIKPGMSAYVKASYGKPIGIWFVIE